MTEWLTTISEATSPMELNMNVFGTDLAGFLSVAIICGLCLAATAVWALTVVTYTRFPHKHS